MKHLAISLITLTILGCKSTEPEISQQFPRLEVIQGEMASNKWQPLARFSPRYPIVEAKARREGCATIEYVITPQYDILDIKVVDATSRYFGKESQNVLSKWDWSTLPKDILVSPIKTQTRFEFCLEDGNGRCSAPKLAARTQCSGSDVVSSVGSIIKKAKIR